MYNQLPLKIYLPLREIISVTPSVLAGRPLVAFVEILRWSVELLGLEVAKDIGHSPCLLGPTSMNDTKACLALKDGRFVLFTLHTTNKVLFITIEETTEATFSIMLDTARACGAQEYEA